jgi:hypothetical protein
LLLVFRVTEASHGLPPLVEKATRANAARTPASLARGMVGHFPTVSLTTLKTRLSAAKCAERPRQPRPTRLRAFAIPP